MTFKVGSSTRKNGGGQSLEVTNAQLNVLLKYPKKKKGGPNPSKHVTLSVYQVFPGENRSDILLSMFSNLVRHTKWQELVLPTSTLQRLIDGQGQLHIRIECAQCETGVLEPVLLLNRKSKKRRAARAMKGGQQRRKKRRYGEKMNKRRPFIVVIAQKVQKQKRRRGKRNARECEVQPGNCCLKTLYVSFKDLGWDEWVLKPAGYFANYCEGNCPEVLLPNDFAHRHSGILEYFKHRNKEKAPSDIKFCCSPKKMRSIALLYLNDDGNIIKTNLANMSVEECGCA